MEINSKIDLSIIIPCYNAAKFIKNTLNRICFQENNGLNFEILLIDDCSTDNIFIMIQSYLKEFNNIFYFKNESNRGVSFSRNIGIARARGKYLYFLDADDSISSTFFKEIKESMLKNMDLISFGFKKVSASYEQDYLMNILDQSVTYSNEVFLKKYFNRSILQHMCSFVVKRSILINNNIKFDENTFFAEDQEFQIKCMMNSTTIEYVPKVLFIYNFHEENTMNSTFSLKRLTAIDAFLRIEQICIDKPYYKFFVNYFFYNYFSMIILIEKSGLSIDIVNKDSIEKIDNLYKLTPSLLNNKISYIVNILFYLNKVSPYLFKQLIKRIN